MFKSSIQQSSSAPHVAPSTPANGFRAGSNSNPALQGEQKNGPDQVKKERFPSFAPTAISMPSGGGSVRPIDGKFQVNPSTGTGGYTIQIPTTAGRHNFSPNLSLSYNTGAGNGAFGLGWHLNIASISRKIDKGWPRYRNGAEEDVFVFSGAEDLVPLLKKDPITGSIIKKDSSSVIEEKPHEGYLVRQYIPRIEGSFIRIERWMSLGDEEDVHWRTITGDNMTTIYGFDSNSRICSAPGDGPRRIFSWLACETYDPKGSVVYYIYKPENSDNVPITANEMRRGVESRSTNRHIKVIRYGNKTPTRTPGSTKVIPAHELPETDWMFSVVFDYGDHDANDPSLQESNSWPCRQDPFSTYHAGFEVRTYRLCKRILMFHHFPVELKQPATLTSYTTLKYNEQPTFSYLTGVMKTGCMMDGNVRQEKSMPTLEFEYSEAPSLSSAVVRAVSLDDMRNVHGAEGIQYQLIDIEGQGLPGLLIDQAGEWYYKANRSANNMVNIDGEHIIMPRFEEAKALPQKPSANKVGNHTRFADVDGDGVLDLVAVEGNSLGFYGRDEDGGWTNFTAFRYAPDVDLNDPNVRILDLTGDGFADILVTEDSIFTIYESMGDQGYAPPEQLLTAINEEKGPRVIFNDPEATIALANMSGGGLADIVRVRNRNICYWPNLGFGRFGPIVHMDQAPLFDCDANFRSSNIHFADIDGSGTVDIVYTGGAGTIVFFNLSGNGWSEGQRLECMPPVDNMTSVGVADLLGRGTSCLLWSSALPYADSASLQFVDLSSGQKPHLLTKITNNCGLETKVHYEPSTKFWVLDEVERRPWLTRLPFPVFCVEEQTVTDTVTQTRFSTRYRYHHGHYDSFEREFRGFGMVEQWDADELGVSVQLNAPLRAANLDPQYATPPLHIKNWYHTGLYVDRQKISHYMAREYFGAPLEGSPGWDEYLQTLLPSTVLPDQPLSAIELRSACRALKGSVLRTEIYADDGTDKALLPYEIKQQNSTIMFLQNEQSKMLPAAFTVRPRETITHHYDRNLQDPRIQQDIALRFDDFGNVLRSVVINHGRMPGQSSLPADAKAKQEQTVLAYTTFDFTKLVDEPSARVNPMLCQSSQYEISGVAKKGQVYTVPDFVKEEVDIFDSLPQVPFHKKIDHSKPQRRLITSTRNFFRKDDLSAELPLGTIERLMLPSRSYELAQSLEQIRSIFVGSNNQLLLANAENVLTGIGSDEGGYVDLDDNGLLWAPSGTTSYSDNPISDSSDELAQAVQSFFSPKSFTSQFGHRSTISYDPYYMEAIRSVDPIGNVTSARLDYTSMNPVEITDPNGNRKSSRYDALGMISGLAYSGREGEKVGDHLDDFSPFRSNSEIQEFLRNPTESKARDFLGSASECSFRNTEPIKQSGQPLCSIAIWRDTHTSEAEAGKIGMSVTYLDGFGRPAQTKELVEPGPLEDGGEVVSPRWLVSGKVVYNNKAQIVQKYEPYFDRNSQFSDTEVKGVSSFTFYDPLQRVVGTLQPNHAWDKIIYSPWEQTKWDMSDTVAISDPGQDIDIGSHFKKLSDSARYLPSWFDARKSGAMGTAERDAALKSEKHARTPTTMVLDSQGRTVLSIVDNGSEGKYSTSSDQDSSSRVLATYDPRGRQLCDNTFNFLGELIRQDDMDSGTRWTISDCTGNELRSWNSRGIETRYVYDNSRRVSEVLIQEGNEPEILVHKNIYGETSPAAEENGRRGKVYQVQDQAGVLMSDIYDFKGNCLRTSRRLCKNYKTTINWSVLPELENEAHIQTTKLNALNKVIEKSNGDGSGVRYTYGLGGLMETVHAQKHSVDGQPPSDYEPYVTEMTYNARGQRISIAYANGATTQTTFDPLRFRRVAQVTKRGAKTVQALHFTYDIGGLVTHIKDDAQQTLFFRNNIVEPTIEYSYDAVGRLIEASGREHLGQSGNGASEPELDSDQSEFVPYQPGDGQAMAKYVETYSYDSCGNITRLKHAGSDSRSPGWTRTYSYAEPSYVDSAFNGNRLSGTTVGSVTDQYKYDGDPGKHGLITSMAHIPTMIWDYTDRLRSSSRQVVNNGGTPVTTWYVYDAQGTRVRKVVEPQTSPGDTPVKTKETVYLDGLDYFRKYDTGGQTTFERRMLIVKEAASQIATIETRTIGEEPGVPKQLTKYQIANQLQSVMIELDENGEIISYEEYTPFGSTSYRSTGVKKKFRFSGKELDTESGLYYFGARYYAPWLGRWISPDPGGYEDGLNLYSFVGNNPAGFVDSSGQSGEDDQGMSWFDRQRANARAWVESNPYAKGAVKGVGKVLDEVSTPKGALKFAGTMALGAVLIAEAPLAATALGAYGVGYALGKVGRAAYDAYKSPTNENKEHVGEVLGEEGTNAFLAVATGKIGGSGGTALKEAVQEATPALVRSAERMLGAELATAGGPRLPGIPSRAVASETELAMKSVGGGGGGGAKPSAKSAGGAAPKGEPKLPETRRTTRVDKERLEKVGSFVQRAEARLKAAFKRGDENYLRNPSFKIRESEIRNLANPYVSEAVKGRIIEKLVAQMIKSSSDLRGNIEYIANVRDQSGYWRNMGNSKMDFALKSTGKGEGWIKIEITTWKSYVEHSERTGYKVNVHYFFHSKK